MQLQICLGRLLRSLRMSAQLSGSDTDPRSVLRIARLFVLSVAFPRLQACVCDLSWSAWPYTTPTYSEVVGGRPTICHLLYWTFSLLVSRIAFYGVTEPTNLPF